MKKNILKNIIREIDQSAAINVGFKTNLFIRLIIFPSFYTLINSLLTIILSTKNKKHTKI